MSLPHILLKIVFLCTLLTDDSIALPSHATGDIHKCSTTLSNGGSIALRQLNVLPGLGFDNLHNLERGNVYNYKFSNCNISPEGFYLLPDNVSFIPAQQNEVRVVTDNFDHFSDWRSETSHSINEDANVLFSNISGMFSEEYQKFKSNFVKEKCHAARFSFRYHLYTINMNANAQLDPAFKSHILNIAANIQKKNTKLAHYLAELLVRDYGTHVVTSIDAGAVLSQTTFTCNHSEIDAKTSLSKSEFFDLFRAGFSVNHAVTEDDKKQTKNVYTIYGGMNFHSKNFSFLDWENSISDHIVAIDRRGQPLYSVLIRANIPELPAETLTQVSEYIYNVITRYYTINSHEGSLNHKLPKKIDDATHKMTSIYPYTFGGIFQLCNNSDKNSDICTSNNLTQINPLTESFNCEYGYQKLLIHSGTVSLTNDVSKSATYHTYWCALPPHNVSTYGLLFGGGYTHYSPNIITGNYNCSGNYSTLFFGTEAKICYSESLLNASAAVYFGGFYGCYTGNPMAATGRQFINKNYPYKCPSKQYKAILMTIDDDCALYYCILTNFMPIVPRLNENQNFFPNSKNENVL